MKKSLLAIGTLALMLAVSGCNNGQTTEKTSDEADKVTVTEQVNNDADAEAANETASGAEETSTDAATGATEAAPQADKPQQTAKPTSLADLKNDKTIKWYNNGLGYKVVKEGTGAHPNMDDVVKVKYTGKHLDGSVFDSSGDQTVDFPLTHVIPGFSQGIVNMNRGAIYELYIPSELGYGPQGTPGGPIAPNEDLIFEIELVDF